MAEYQTLPCSFSIININEFNLQAEMIAELKKFQLGTQFS